MDRLTTTRRQLHGIAECLLAGAQHRACGRIQLRVLPGGFATTGDPAIRLDGNDLIVGDERRVRLTGSYGDIGSATGHGFGEPTNYHDHSGVLADETVELDPVVLQWLTEVLVRADAALRVLAPKETPVLWPEHFDVAILLAGTSFGVSPGDAANPTPYAYVSNTDRPRDDYWNAGFGAFVTLEQTPPIADLVAFWTEGLSRLEADANEASGGATA
jgi:hypothetical protein